MNYLGTIAYRTGTMGAKIDEGFCASFIEAMNFLHKKNVAPIFFMRGQSSWLAESANQIAECAKGGWVLMLDTDHVFASNAFFEMIDTFETQMVDVLVGFTQKRQPPYTPCIYNYDFDPVKPLVPIIPTGLQKHDLIPIDASGCACLMIRSTVFTRIKEDLRERPFQPRWKYQELETSLTSFKYLRPDGDGDPFFWEDISFFRRLNLLGIKSYCAPWIPFYHLETRMVTERLIGKRDSNE